VQSSSQIITINKPTPSLLKGRMPFLLPNQQCQSTQERKTITELKKTVSNQINDQCRAAADCQLLLCSTPNRRGIKRCFCLTSVCLYVTYIGPKSRTERPFKIKRSKSPGRFTQRGLNA